MYTTMAAVLFKLASPPMTFIRNISLQRLKQLDVSVPVMNSAPIKESKEPENSLSPHWSSLDDEIFRALQELFLRKGCPKLSLQDVPITNKLLVQIFILHLEGAKPRKVIFNWLVTLHPTLAELKLTEGRVYGLASSAFKKFQELSGTEKESFLTSPAQLEAISDSLTELGITRRTVFTPPLTVVDPRLVIKNKSVIELERFRKSMYLRSHITIKWLASLGAFDAKEIPRSIIKLFEAYKKCSKVNHRNSESLINLLESPFQLYIPQPVRKRKICTCNIGSVVSVGTQCDEPVQKAGHVSLEGIDVTKNLYQEEQRKNLALVEEVTVLKLERKFLLGEIEQLKSDLDCLKQRKWLEEDKTYDIDIKEEI